MKMRVNRKIHTYPRARAWRCIVALSSGIVLHIVTVANTHNTHAAAVAAASMGTAAGIIGYYRAKGGTEEGERERGGRAVAGINSFISGVWTWSDLSANILVT